MANATVALDSARVYLNDVGQQIWTDTALIPYLKEAYKDLMIQLWLNGIPVIREKTSTPIVVPASSTPVILTLPADLVEPIGLKERAQGSSEPWISMTETDFEPDTKPDVNLRYWAWREENINLVGATNNREVQLRYLKSLTIPTTTNSPLGFIFSEFFLGPQTAAYAAGSVGNVSLAQELLFIHGSPTQMGIAGAKLDGIIRANVKGQQNLPARRIPYRRFARSRLLL